MLIGELLCKLLNNSSGCMHSSEQAAQACYAWSLNVSAIFLAIGHGHFDLLLSCVNLL